MNETSMTDFSANTLVSLPVSFRIGIQAYIVNKYILDLYRQVG